MEVEILKIITGYSVQRKLLDYQAICQIINIYLEHYQTKYYCKTVIEVYQHPRNSESEY